MFGLEARLAKYFSRLFKQHHADFDPGRDIPKAPKSQLSPRQMQACKHHKVPTFRYRGRAK